MIRKNLEMAEPHILPLHDRLRQTVEEYGEPAILDVYKNGANLIILNSRNEIYTQVANYGEKKRMLPGGGVELSETPKLAAVREAHEESGLLIHPSALQLCAVFSQRPYGLVTLYALQHEGEILDDTTDEILSREFMSFEQVMERRDEFFLGYLRMIVHYLRWVHVGKKRQIIEAVLAEQVEVPRHLTKGALYV
jgi:8-oxo-dGTP pyrophosphatase MutT (NUDIX family)